MRFPILIHAGPVRVLAEDPEDDVAELDSAGLLQIVGNDQLGARIEDFPQPLLDGAAEALADLRIEDASPVTPSH